MKTLVAAVDCGTTVIKAAIFDLAGRRKSLASRECPCVKRRDGRIENNPRAISKLALACLKEGIERGGINPRNIAAVSISNQRATTICVGRDGRAIGNAVSWQDMRGAGEIEDLRRRIDDARYYGITGLPNHPVFTLAKLLWIKRREPSLYKKTARFVLVHDYVLRELGCADFYCDWSNASLTGMFDISAFQWSREILDLCGLEKEKLSELVPSGRQVGAVSRRASRLSGLLEGTPIVSGGGDQQCAGLGAGATAPGVLEVTLGTAAVPLCCVERVSRDPEMRVTCCAHAVPGKWNVEGLQNSAGASLDWLTGILGLESRMPDAFLRDVARAGPGAGGVLFYPYLAGSSAPHWNPHARGMFLGLAHASDRPSLARAVMEGVTMETREILDVFASMKIPIEEVRLTGGCTAMEVWNQMQADIYGKPVCTLRESQASLVGAAMLAACGADAFASLQEAAENMVRIGNVYNPAPENVAEYEKAYYKYCVVRRSIWDSGIFQEMSRLR